MERARTEWLRSLELEQDEIITHYDVMFVVRSVSIDYLKPAVFNDALQVTCKLEKLGKASITFEQKILREVDGMLLTQGIVRIASLSASKKKPVAIPETIFKQFLTV
jgi:acyl-CoA thioester hydrolase